MPKLRALKAAAARSGPRSKLIALELIKPEVPLTQKLLTQADADRSRLTPKLPAHAEAAPAQAPGARSRFKRPAQLSLSSSRRARPIPAHPGVSTGAAQPRSTPSGDWPPACHRAADSHPVRQRWVSRARADDGRPGPGPASIQACRSSYRRKDAATLHAPC